MLVCYVQMGGRGRGRPPAQTSIVPPAQVQNQAATRAEVWLWNDLVPAVATPDLCLQWVAVRHLVHNEVQCPRCGSTLQ